MDSIRNNYKCEEEYPNEKVEEILEIVRIELSFGNLCVDDLGNMLKGKEKHHKTQIAQILHLAEEFEAHWLEVVLIGKSFLLKGKIFLRRFVRQSCQSIF